MEKFKDPAMLLSIADAVGLVGVTFYFYKQLEILKSDIAKTDQNVKKIIAKIGEIEKGDQNHNESLKTLTGQMENISYDLDNLTNQGDELDEDLEVIIRKLEDNNIIVDRPSQKSKQYRSGDRKQNTNRARNKDYEVSKREKTRNDNSYEEKYEKSRRPTWVKSKPNDNKEENNDDEDMDDEELINSVRRQQTRN